MMQSTTTKKDTDANYDTTTANNNNDSEEDNPLSDELMRRHSDRFGLPWPRGGRRRAFWSFGRGRNKDEERSRMRGREVGVPECVGTVQEVLGCGLDCGEWRHVWGYATYEGTFRWSA